MEDQARLPYNPQGEAVVEIALHPLKEALTWVTSPESKSNPYLFHVNFQWERAEPCLQTLGIFAEEHPLPLVRCRDPITFQC